ncbi:MAG: ROK family transcriptional regulator [Candidatus Marinimicrobia bacterium]|nr:ROK family transcriptional regulator [Candidatus Neomarinimicrobiota bacterium]
MINKNFRIAKELNEIKILNILLNEGPVSRSELAKRTNITKVTIAEILKRLGNEGFIDEAGKGESTVKGGKKPNLVKLNPNKGYVIGVEYKRNFARVAIANIQSEILKKEQFEYEIGTSLNEVIKKTFDCIDSCLIKLKIPESKLISIALGVPGFIDYENGELIYADTMKGWERKPLAAKVSQRYKVPVIMENDVNLIAIGEDLVGAGKNARDIVCIWIGDGVGAGIIIGNQLIRGASGIAGEIGYLEVNNSLTNYTYLKHLYTNQRYVGDILSQEHLFNVLKIALEFQTHKLEKPIDKYHLAELLELGDHGHSVVQEILDEYSFVLANVCTELIKTINTNLIILSGPIIENSQYLFIKIQQFVKNKMREIPFDTSSIVLGGLKGDDACIMGAISLALQVIYKPYIIHKQLDHVHIKE